MKAPEKIYLSNYNSGVTYNWHNERLALNDIEYIRTDVFIEKVCKFLDDRIKHDSIDYPMATVHLIDDVKNYMKGE
jgi:hypothetical protein